MNAQAPKAMESAGSSGGNNGPIIGGQWVRAKEGLRESLLCLRLEGRWPARGRSHYCICYSVLVVAAMHALHHAISY